MPAIFIDDATPLDALDLIGGTRGLVPRDYTTVPVGAYHASRSVELPLIPRREWSNRIRAMESARSRLSDIRETGNFGSAIPSLDQNPWGYCWAHSATHAVMLLRARDHQPYVALSAFAVAATIKQGRDEGAWGALALDFIRDRGVPSQAFWPQGDAKLTHGTPACWENAAKHKVSEGWMDLDTAVYDRTLTFDQVATCLLSRIPVIGDYDWWGHSVCLLDLVETSPDKFGVRIWNSWGDAWGDRGTGILIGKRAIPDGAVAPRVVTAAVD